MTLFEEMLNKLHRGQNMYLGFPVSMWRGTWYNDPGAQREMFKKCLDKCGTHGSLVIEVGSFVGESAIFMAKYLRECGRGNSLILCVDTWLGGVDHHLRAPEKMRTHFGRFDLYYKFMANVIEQGCSDMILPLTLDSLNAARLLAHHGVQADLIYCDASHELGDAGRDFEAYWPLVRAGGIFLIDDYSGHFPGVVHDWNEFAAKHKIPQSQWDVSGEKIAVVKV